MTQGLFLLLDLHILKMQDNTGAFQTVKASDAFTKRLSSPSCLCLANGRSSSVQTSKSLAALLTQDAEHSRGLAERWED